MKLLIKDTHGLRINTDICQEVILAVPQDNIVSQNGEIASIFGYGCVTFLKNKAGNEVQGNLLIATIFNCKPTAIKPSTHFEGYIDIVFDKDAYFAYFEQDVSNTPGNTVPVIKDSTNVELLYNKLNGGKFSEYVDYNNQMDIIQNNLKLNKRLGNSPLIFDELSIANGFVDESGEPYRYSLKGRCKPVSLLTATMLSDPYSSLIHQDAKTAMMISLNNKKKREPSLLEKYTLM